MDKKLEDMTVEELEAYELELTKKLKIRTLAEQQAKLKELEAKEAREAEEAHKQKIIEEYKNSVAADSAEVKLNVDVKTSKTPDKNKYAEWLKQYTGGQLRTYESIESKGDKSFNMWGTSADDPRNSNCPSEVDNWSPEGVWVAAIWHDFYEYTNLLQVVVPGLNIQAGQGYRALIRTISPFSVDDISENMSSCSCLSCTSTSLNKVYIDIEQHGFSTVICEWDLWDVGEQLRSATLKEFALVWSKFFDSEIYDALDGATGNTSANQTIDSCTTDCSTPTGDCCTDTFMMDLYCAFDKAIGELRTQYYNPDYIIVHPEVARVFHGMQGPQPVFYNNGIEFGKNGKLASIFGVKVIEYPGANRIEDDSNIAIILDSRRAIGAPFGMKPRMESERNKECNAYEYYMWCYWGVKVLTQNAIALIECDDGEQ